MIPKPKDDLHGECPDCGARAAGISGFDGPTHPSALPNSSAGYRTDFPLNENCLAGMACPKCKSNGPFLIVTTCWAQVHDDGIEDTSEHEWDENSTCLCKACKFSSKVGSFEVVLTEIEKAQNAKAAGDWDYDHPSWGRCDWRKEVGEENTQLGYFDWVIHSLESHADDAEE